LRQRKDKGRKKKYATSTMNTLLINPKTLVGDVLRHLPQTSHVFIGHHTDCVGCQLTRFCSLQEVSHLYNLDMQVFIAELRQYTQSLHITPKE